MARSGHCRTCGATIRPKAKDMSVGAASRIHYWRHHPEVMLAGQAKKKWRQKPKAKPARSRRSKTK